MGGPKVTEISVRMRKGNAHRLGGVANVYASISVVLGAKKISDVRAWNQDLGQR